MKLMWLKNLVLASVFAVFFTSCANNDPQNTISSPTKAEKSSVSKNISANKSLFIENGGVEILIQEVSKTSLNGILRLKLQAKFKTIDPTSKRITAENIPNGDIQFKALLIANTKNNLEAISEKIDTTANITDGIIQIELPININKIPKNESIVELALNINGIENQIVSIGQLRENLTRSNADFRSLKESIDQIATNNESKKTKDLNFVVEEIELERVSVSEISTITGKPQKLLLQLKTCLKNSLSGNVVANEEILITGLGSQNLKSNANGCVSWNESIDFDYAHASNYLTKEIKIKIDGAFYKSDEKSVTVSINPWEYQSNTKTVFIDERFKSSENNISSILSNARDPEITLSDIAISFVGREFALDDNLNISPIRFYKISMKPMIRRFTSLGEKNEPIGSGTYNLQYTLELNNNLKIAATESVIHTQKIKVNAISDTIVATIPIRFDDLRTILTRNKLSLHLSGGGLKSKTYTGAFEATDKTSIVRLEPSNIDITKITPNKKKVKIDALKLFQNKFQLDALDEKTLAKISITNSEKENFIERPAEFEGTLSKLCKYFFKNQNNIKVCQSTPNDVLGYSVSEHSQKVLSKPTVRSSDTINLSTTSSFSFNDSHGSDNSSGNSKTRGMNGTLGGGFDTVGLGIKAGFGLAIGENWYTTTSQSHNKSKGSSIQISSNKSVIADEVVLNFDVQILKCINIIPKVQAKNIKTGAQLCSSQSFAKNINEKFGYIYILSFNEKSPIQDMSGDSLDRPWTFLIRGDDRIKNFTQMLQDAGNSISLEKYPPFPDTLLEKAQSKYDGFFPALLTIK